MSSQFDTLLDFGDDPPPSTNGTAETTNGNNDNFDPFGPSPAVDKAGAGDSGMLLDFSVTTEVSGKAENGTSDPFDAHFTVTSSTTDDSSSNPFMDISSADTQSSSANPFADMSTTDTSNSQSANPLYDLMDDDFAAPQPAESHSQSGNPLYDLSENDVTDDSFTQHTTTTTSAPSVNPMYDFADLEDTQMTEETQEVDFDGGTGMEKSTPSEDILVQANNGFADEDQVVPEVTQQQESGPRGMMEEEEEETTQEREATQQEEEEESGGQESFEQNVELYIHEDVEEQTAADDAEEEVSAPVVEVVTVVVADDDDDDNDSTKGRRRSRSKSPSRSRSISSEREVLNEEEELRQDGRTVYKNREEQSFTESGVGDSRQMREDYGVATSGGVENGTQREDFHFSEMSSVKSQFEHAQQEPQRKPVNIRDEVAHSEGGVYESQPTTFQAQYDDETEEGIFENQPQQRVDVARESDRNIGAELPSVGTAKSMRDRFATGQVERASGSLKKEQTPPDAVDGGVFENQPHYNPDVVHSGEYLEEKLPEQGYARNIAGRFKELEKGSGGAPSPGRREITPDRSGKVEYVSEPRGQVERYEGQAEAGVFESQPQERADVVKSGEYSEEVLPERGTAKNVAQRFKQMSSGTPSPAPRGKREITPDTSGRVEYVSEPRGHVETYEGQAESGVFESQPANREDVVKSDQLPEEILPERGAARNIAAKFREMEKTTKSPPSPTKYKEFTPPRENGSVSGVYESNPTRSPEVVTSETHAEEILPERGTAKNLVNRFRQLSSGDNSPGKSPRAKKEFTPPPQEGVVFENNPKQFIPDYNRPAESGILESHPEVRSDVVRGDEPPKYEEELPERGFTRSLVSAWKQRETESTKISPTASGKPKEFTPPREEPRVAQQRPAPRTPKSPGPGAGLSDGSVHPRDLPGQYQPQVEPSVFESEPERLEGVVKEDDTDWMAGMPKADTTKKMLAKFRNIQAEASKEQPRPQPSGRKGGDDSNSSEAASDQVVRSKSMRVAVQLEKCGACQKTVYAMEKIEIEKNAYHKSCFRCSHCHCVLTPKTFAVNNRVMFCTNHYKQLFAAKGNYDEGFGRDQHKKRWKSESNLADGQTEEDSSSSEQHH